MKKPATLLAVAAIIVITLFLALINIPGMYRLVLSVVDTLPLTDKDQLKKIEDEYADNIAFHNVFMNISGIAHRLTGQYFVNDVLRTKTNQLLRIEEIQPFGDQDRPAKTVRTQQAFLDLTTSRHIPVTFVQINTKAETLAGELPLGFDHTNDPTQSNYSEFLKRSGADVLDLRTQERSDSYYATDHHWTLSEAFLTAREVETHLIQKRIVARELSDRMDLSNFSEITFPHSFLGSSGIKVSEWFEGKDDFSIMLPRYETDFVFTHKINGELANEKKGNFYEALFDAALLKDSSYVNKYNAALYGAYDESRIINNLNKAGIKLLLISDSFGRSLAPYMSLFCSDLVYIDPQDDRYTEPLNKLLDQFDFDYVIVMYQGPLNVG